MLCFRRTQTLENVFIFMKHGFISRKYPEQGGVLVRDWESEQLDRNSNVLGEQWLGNLGNRLL